MRTVELCAYRFAAKDFRTFARPDEAGIGLRVVRDLWPFVDAVATGTPAFSGIRLRNARPRP